ncbi:MAG: ABC transporter ATP-binding protein [Thermodesulfovibrionales bacterium]|nr:ABC transporter ATP-binding protein [Thermodesulfovibrionales bacterium]
MIEIKDIWVNVKGFSLEDISINIQNGSCHALIGPTGCGKTTLLEALIGLRKVMRGKIFLDGKDITSLPVHEREFSYVPQDLAIFPHMTVEENIFYGIKHGRVKDKKKRAEAVLELAEQLGIKNLFKRKAAGLSGGEKQRIALIRALAPGYRYLILDEPFSALHEGMRKELWFIMKDLQKIYGLTVLLVTHDLDEAFFLADSISIMLNGKIHQTGNINEVYNRPASISVAEFLGIRNLFRAKKISHQSIYCHDLNKSLNVLPEITENVKDGEAFYAGIRPEDILILTDDSTAYDNLIQGTIILLFTKIRTSTVLFKPAGSSKIIEIEVPKSKKLNLKAMQEIKVCLSRHAIFSIKDNISKAE